MNIPILILSLLPILLLLVYIYRMDKIEKEPIFFLCILFLFGLLACLCTLFATSLLKNQLPFLYLSYYDMNIWQILFKVFITIAFIEELFKWICVFFPTWKSKYFDHAFDAIVYSVFVSMGFATYENLIYSFSYASYGFLPIFFRGIISIPSHMAFGVFMGYYLSLYKTHPHKKIYLFYSLFIPTTLHFIYDLCLVKKNIFMHIIMLLFVIILLLNSLRLIKEISAIKSKIKIKE